MVRISGWDADREERRPEPQLLHLTDIVEAPLLTLKRRLELFVPNRELTREISGAHTLEVVDTEIELGQLLKAQPSIGKSKKFTSISTEDLLEAVTSLPKSRDELTERVVGRYGGLGRTIDLYRESVDATRGDERFLFASNSSTAERFTVLAKNLEKVAGNLEHLSRLVVQDPAASPERTRSAFYACIAFEQASPLAIRRTIEMEIPFLGYPGLELPPEKRLKYPPRHFVGVQFKRPEQ